VQTPVIVPTQLATLPSWLYRCLLQLTQMANAATLSRKQLNIWISQIMPSKWQQSLSCILQLSSVMWDYSKIWPSWLHKKWD